MDLIKVIVNNYKSFRNSKNVLYLDPNVTAIIGKNESGKSNILEAIGNLPYFEGTATTYYTNKNRSANEENISLILGFRLNENEIKQFNVKKAESEVTFTNPATASISGGFSEIIEKDTILSSNIESIVKSKGNFNIWNAGNNEQNRKRLSRIMDILEMSSTTILLNYKQEIVFLKQIVNRSYEQYNDLINKLDVISSSLAKYYSLFPRIFYRAYDQQLEYSYDFGKIKEILGQKNDIFYRLMLAARIDEKEIIRAFEENNEGDKQNLRYEIEEKISENIGEEFNSFYTQEIVKFKARFEGNTIKFSVNTNKGKQMLITERSNGLRWYLSLFIDILANDFRDSSVIYLFDEPGVFLHVNAQKELLNLFDDLSKKGHKVMYTTHSPSMIDGENILNVRVVEKNDIGNTVIYNSCYNQNLSSESKMETLSPLVKAIGADLKFNLGPHFSKQNIVTEGITDYMYIKAIMNHLQVKEPPNIIPSAGVENVNRIISILMGWGCDYKILLDYDNAGRKEYNVLVEKLDPSLKEYILFINGKDKPSLEEMKSSPVTMEDLISDIDFNKLNHKLNDTKDNKVLVAKEFYDKVASKQIKPELSTVERFEQIFKTFNII